MSNAMDGLRVSLANQQQKCDTRSKSVDEKDHKKVVGSLHQKVVEDIGENSNGSSNETGRDEEMTRVQRGGSLLASNMTSRHHRHTPSLSNHTSSNHHNTSSRAHYCQFETPADETRGTFPDDFDEELFINSGQLDEETREVRDQFDEEMESSQPEDHEDHHHHHPLTLDTADHSESSDIEEIMYSSTENTPTGGGSGSNSSDIPGSSLNKSHPCPLPARPEGQGSPEPMQQDLSTRTSNFNDEERMDHNNSTMETSILHGNDESEDNENDAALIYNPDDPEPNIGSSSSISPLRKRKGDLEAASLGETLPAKKSVKEEMLVDEMNFSPILDSPDTIEDVIDIEVREKSRTTRPVIPTKDNPPPQMDEWLTIFMGWSHAERLMAINELIHVCEPTQVRHMMQVIEPQFQRDFISLLPKELALYVLSFLEPKDLLRAAQTCRYWRILCDDNLLWREKCREAGIGYFSAMSQRIHSKRSRGNQPSCPGTNCAGAASNCISNTNGSESPSSCNISRWKAAFLRQHNVEANWRFRPMRPTKVLKGHDDHVITCLQFSSNRIVSGSDDNTLKVWSATTGKCLRTLIGHTGGVWSSQMSGTTIVSGSTDRTLRVWNADTGASTHTLYGHTSTVRCMHLCGRKVVSGSRDATLRVWDVDSGECLHVLVGHMAAVRCVQYNGTIVVSGAYDYMVRVWDVEREECLHQLNGHTNRVYSLQFDGIHVVSGSLDTSIRVWDVKTGVCKHTLMGHQSLTSGMELRENLLVSGNADSTVKIWDINTGQCLLTLSGPNKHLSAVTCLQLINKFVITSSDDGTVKLWDIRTGEFVRNLVTLSSGGSGGVVWRIRASETKLVCAVGSRNGTEETKLLVLDFDVEASK